MHTRFERNTGHIGKPDIPQKIGKVKNCFAPSIDMADSKLLLEARRTEKSRRIVRRLCMLIALVALGNVFVRVATQFHCDRRTVALWYYRVQGCTNIGELCKSLSDRPRSGRPTLISRDLLEQGRLWCENRVFTPAELN